MSKLIAQVRLAPGEVGFYDPLTFIHLTNVKPDRDIYSHMTVTNLRSAVKSRRLLLVSGSLEPETLIVRSGKKENSNTEVRVTKTPAVDAQKTEAPVIDIPSVEVPKKEDLAIDTLTADNSAAEVEDSITEGVVTITEDNVEVTEGKKKKNAKKA